MVAGDRDGDLGIAVTVPELAVTVCSEPLAAISRPALAAAS